MNCDCFKNIQAVNAEKNLRFISLEAGVKEVIRTVYVRDENGLKEPKQQKYSVQGLFTDLIKTIIRENDGKPTQSYVKVPISLNFCPFCGTEINPPGKLSWWKRLWSAK